MRQAIRKTDRGRLALLGVLGLGLALCPGVGAGGGPGGNPPLERITVRGKYDKLLRKLYMPQDAQKYTEFCDWGPSKGQDYGPHKDVPRGFWVYSAPNWYIWAHKDSSKDFTMKLASANGKYDNLIHRVPAPEDLNQFGKFREFGFSKAKNYAGHNDIPPGYWVYVFPHWYVWGKQGPPLSGAALEASMNCKYTQLLKKIALPQDQKIYGQLYEEGYWDGQTYGPYQNLPRGYWTYAAPHWYIWGDKRNTKVHLH
jgi:hypothetical protein